MCLWMSLCLYSFFAAFWRPVPDQLLALLVAHRVTNTTSPLYIQAGRSLGGSGRLSVLESTRGQ